MNAPRPLNSLLGPDKLPINPTEVLFRFPLPSTNWAVEHIDWSFWILGVSLFDEDQPGSVRPGVFYLAPGPDFAGTWFHLNNILMREGKTGRLIGPFACRNEL